MPNRNAEFLAVIDSVTRADILASIGKQYGISPEEAYAEVTAVGAEHLLDYMVEPLRSATSILMQMRGLRGY